MKHWPVSRIVRLLVAVLLTGFVLYKAHPSAILEAGAQANLWWIGLAILLVIVDRALMAYRWLVLLCPIDAAIRPPFAEIMRVFFVSTFLGTFLPASVGGDAVRAYGLARLRVSPGVAVASVIMDRVLGVVSIVLVGAFGLLLAQRSDLASNPAIQFSFLVATAVCVVAAFVVFSEPAARAATRLALALPLDGVRKIATELMNATRAYGRFHGELANVLVGSIAVQMLRILQAYCLGRAVAIMLPITSYVTFIPLILLVMLLPVSINGIGTSQVAFAWLFGRAGVPVNAAVALSILFVGLGVVGNLPGALLYVSGPKNRLAERISH